MRWIPCKATHEVKSPDFVKIHGPSPSPLGPHDKCAKQPRNPARSRADSARCREYRCVCISAQRHEHRIHLGIVGSRRFGDRRFHVGSNQLAEPAFPSAGGATSHDFGRRDQLYTDFIVAASRAYGVAIVSSEPQIQDLIGLYAMISRMRVRSSPQTVACALNVMVVTITTYSSPNKSIPELNELIESGTDIDPLKDFAEAAREELHQHPARPR